MSKPLFSWNQRVLLLVGMQTIAVLVLYLVPVLQQYVFVPGAAFLCAVLSASLGIEAVFVRRNTSPNLAHSPWRVVFALYGKVVLWSLLLLLPILLALLWGQVSHWRLEQADLVYLQAESDLPPQEFLRETPSCFFYLAFPSSLGSVVKHSLHFSLWLFAGAAACGAGVGVALGFLWQKRRWAYIALAAVVLGTLGYSGWRLLVHPTAFTTNLFVGFWFVPDPYAEFHFSNNVWFPPAFLLARVQHLLGVLGGLVFVVIGLDPHLLLWKYQRWWRHKKQTLFLLLGACSIPFLFHHTDISALPEETLRKKCSATRETQHFVFHYPPKGVWNNPMDMDLVAFEYEFRYYQLHQKLGTEPNWKTPWWQRAVGLGNDEPTDKISVYLLDDPRQAADMLLSPRHGEAFARPWKKDIFFTQYLPWSLLAVTPDVTHELAHIFAGRYGDSIFHISRVGPFPNLGMIESMAQALSGKRATHQLELLWAANFDGSQALEDIPLESSFRPYFGMGERSRGQTYTLTGSFLSHLSRQYGFVPLTQVYKRGGRPHDFAAVYGKPFFNLEAEWRKAEQNLPFYPSGDSLLFWNQFTNYGHLGNTFAWGGSSLCKEICDAWKPEALALHPLAAQRCQKVRNGESATNLVLMLEVQELIRFYPEESSWHLLAAWLWFQENQFDRAAQALQLFWKHLAKRPLTPQLESWAVFLEGNTLFHTHQFAEAKAAFEALLYRTDEYKTDRMQVQMIQDWLERCRFAAHHFYTIT